MRMKFPKKVELALKKQNRNSHNVELIQLICSSNQLSEFCRMETLALKGLSRDQRTTKLFEEMYVSVDL